MSGRKSIDLRTVPRKRFVLPFIVMALPMLLYHFLISVVFEQMTPWPTQPPLLPIFTVDFIPVQKDGLFPLATFGADLSARYALGFGTTAFLTCSTVALLIAFWRISERWGAWGALVVFLSASAGMIAMVLSEFDDPLRTLVSEKLLREIERINHIRPPETIAHIRDLISTNQGMGMAALVALAARFADLAFEPGLAEQTEETLRKRMLGFRNTLFLAGLILVFAVATAHSFYHYPLALMTPESAKPFGALASTASSYWGAVYSAVLLSVAVPTYCAISADTRAVAERIGGASHADREAWREKQGLSLAPRQAFVSLLATAAPLLTGPALDLLKSLPG